MVEKSTVAIKGQTLSEAEFLAMSQSTRSSTGKEVIATVKELSVVYKGQIKSFTAKELTGGKAERIHLSQFYALRKAGYKVVKGIKDADIHYVKELAFSFKA
jgi:hypothetical protein